MQHGGLKLTPPDDFFVDQTMISFRAPPPTAPDARMMQRQTILRPSLIVHRRNVGEAASVEVLAGEVTAELVTSIAGLSGLTTEAFAYDDGEPGILVGFDFAAEEVGTARQYHALRKDGPVLTTLTLTVDKLALNEANKTKWLALLSSVVRDGDGGLQS